MSAKLWFAAGEFLQILTAALLATWMVLIRDQHAGVYVMIGAAILVMIALAIAIHRKGERLATSARTAADTAAQLTAAQRAQELETLLASLHAITQARLDTLRAVGAEEDIIGVLGKKLGEANIPGNVLKEWLEETIGPQRTAERIELILRYTRMRASDQKVPNPKEAPPEKETPPPSETPRQVPFPEATLAR